MSKTTTTANIIPIGVVGRPRRATGLLFAADDAPIANLDDVRPLLRAARRRAARRPLTRRGFDLSLFVKPFLGA